MPRNTSGLKRGGPGRPPGVPNKASSEIKEAARSIVEDAEYVESLKRRVKAGRAPHMETLLFHYAYGKPKETVDLNANVRHTAKVVHEHRPA
jgi:hypothetical protein